MIFCSTPHSTPAKTYNPHFERQIFSKMNSILSLIPSEGNHSSADLPPVEPNEFNDEIYGYLTQLHQQQMQQRAQNIAFPRVPSDVQQVLNLNTAFLRFSHKLIAGFIREQTQCGECWWIHEEWLAMPPLPDERAQILSATRFIDGLVDAHASHGGIDEEGFCTAKLAIAVILAELQASEQLECRMKEISDIIWSPRELFDSHRFTREELLRIEWNKAKNDLKALYHHYLYILKCFDIAEHCVNERDREEAVAKVKREQVDFDRRTAAIISSSSSGQVKLNSQLGCSPGSLTTRPEARDGGGQEVSRSSSPENCVSQDRPSNDTATIAKDACNRLLDSLKSLTLSRDKSQESSSVANISDNLSLESTKFEKLADDAEAEGSSPHQEAFARLTQTWVFLNTGHPMNDPPSSASSEHISQCDSGDVTETSGESSGGKGADQAVQRRDQASSDPICEKSSRHGRRQENKDENGDENADENNEEEDDDRGRKRRRMAITTDSWGFACPYYKRDPEKYMKTKTCSTTRFMDMHRLKYVNVLLNSLLKS
jgi:hypothetical protein